MAENKGKKTMNDRAHEELEDATDIETINRVIKGENDLFEKEYNMKDRGLKFTIKMRYPNAIQQAEAHSIVSNLFKGFNRAMPEHLILAYTTIAFLQVTGEDVPDFLKDPEKLYDLRIPMIVGADIQEWMDSFRGY